MTQSTATLLTIVVWTLEKVDAELAQIGERMPKPDSSRVGRARSYVRAAVDELNDARRYAPGRALGLVEGARQ